MVDGNAIIELIISNNNQASPFFSCDGQHRVPITPGTRIKITQHEKKLQLIHPNNYDYFATLREKLGWQSR